MDKKLKFALELAAVIVGLPTVVLVGTGMAYWDNRKKCESPVPESRLEEFSLAVPKGVKVCRADTDSEPVRFELLIAPPSLLCLASLQMVGCTSLAGAGLSFIGPMADADWGTGDLDGGAGKDSATFNFERGRGHATLQMFKSRFGEISGSFTTNASARKGDKKGGKKKKSSDD